MQHVRWSRKDAARFCALHDIYGPATMRGAACLVVHEHGGVLIGQVGPRLGQERLAAWPQRNHPLLRDLRWQQRPRAQGALQHATHHICPLRMQAAMLFYSAAATAALRGQVLSIQPTQAGCTYYL